MFAEISSRGSRLFPEICINLRTRSRASEIRLAPQAQFAGAIVVVGIVAAICLLAVGRIGYERAAAAGEAAVLRAESANADLQDQVASLRDQLALMIGSQREAEARVSAVTPPQSPGSDEAAERIHQLTQALDQSRRELHQAETQRAALAARLRKNESDHAEPGQYKSKLETMIKRLQQTTADLDRALAERDRLRARIAELEQKRPQKWSGDFHLVDQAETAPPQSTADQPRSETLISDAPPAPEDPSRSVAQMARQAVAEARRLLASTGLNVDRLFPQLAQDRGGRGGPFVTPKPDQPDGMTTEKLKQLRSLIKSLPLAVPLDSYQLESRFGPRHDPFNHRSSFHTGIDLSAPYMSPVYATAAGTVTYAGHLSDYGKVIEIDHGNGIATVYGHLHRYIVSVGQQVAEHEQIGLLGSTGRSSGPHVHYEVRVNDEPQDPEKFIGLARVIPVADR